MTYRKLLYIIRNGTQINFVGLFAIQFDTCYHFVSQCMPQGLDEPASNLHPSAQTKLPLRLFKCQAPATIRMIRGRLAGPSAAEAEPSAGLASHSRKQIALCWSQQITPSSPAQPKRRASPAPGTSRPSVLAGKACCYQATR